MIVDHEHKVLIGTPAKTGCTSLEYSIRYRTDVPDGLEIVHWDGGGKKPHGLLVPPGLEGYKRYMTIRHPLDRIVSLWYHHTKPYQMGKEWREFGEAANRHPRIVRSFNSFVRWYLGQRSGMDEDADWTRLSWWLPPNIWLITLGECAAIFEPDEYIRLESYVGDLAGINPYWAKVPHRMSAGHDTSWKQHFNQVTLELVLEDHASADMALFDYQIGL